MTGRKLSHYLIQEKLGEGGMGVAYRALDTHLNRTVCVKVLRGDAVSQPDRRRRFEREAKTASSLNHPNIVTIYDIDTDADETFIAMEWVRGQTLSAMIPRSGLPLAQVLRLAVQIADGLAAAHGAGVIHRDLKPSNLMVTETGLVKILDFGLAKLHEPLQADELGAVPTIDQPAEPETEQGAILGTAAYMSPEQAEGKRVDTRSDIFSFGSVLYEMITGRRAFGGDSKMSTLSAILRDEPKTLSEIAPGVPRDLEKVVTRCLRKDPARRWQTMADIKVALEELKEESSSGRLEAPRAPPRRRAPLWIAVALLVAMAGAGVAWWLIRGPTKPAGPTLTKLTTDSGLTTDPAISRDGKLVAFASDRAGEGNLDLWVRQTAGGEPIRLTHHPAADREPAFSPDSSQIAFRSDRDGGGIYLVSALGGEERLLVKHGHSPRFSPDGQTIAYRIGETGGTTGTRFIEVIPAAGGQSRRIETGLVGTWSPIWSPDGRHLLTIGLDRKARKWDWWLAPAEGGRVEPTGAFELTRRQLSDTSPADWAGESLYFSARSGDTTNLWQVALSSRTGKVTGEPQRLTFGTGVESQSSVSASGNLVFSSVLSNADIWSSALDDRAGKILGEPRQLTEDEADDAYPSLSADGTRMVFVTHRAGNPDIWFKDLTTGKERPLVATPAREGNPRISADGSRVAYDQGWDVFWVPIAGGASEKLCEACSRPEHWSADLRTILFNRLQPSLEGTIYLLDVESRKATRLMQYTKQTLHSPHFSPDEKWILFHHTTGAATRVIWVAPFRGPVEIPQKDWIRITDGTQLDREPRWSPDGNLIYFLSERDGFRCIWAQRVDRGKRPSGAPFAVYHSHMARRLIGSVNDTNAAGLRIVPGKLVFSATETTGNVWMLKYQ